MTPPLRPAILHADCPGCGVRFRIQVKGEVVSVECRRCGGMPCEISTVSGVKLSMPRPGTFMANFGDFIPAPDPPQPQGPHLVEPEEEQDEEKKP
jgi:hypothetical protein